LRAEQTLSAATVARSLLGEAVVLATAGGGRDEEALEALVDQAEATLTETGRRADVLLAEMGGSNSEVEGAVTAFVTAARDLADALVRERAVGTIEAHFGSVTGTFDQLTAVLVAERDRRERHIAAVRAGVGDVARAARFLVAFFIPAGAVIGVLLLARLRQRRMLQGQEARRELESRRARDEFLTALAHELRTPLTAIVGSAEMLRGRDRPLDAATRQEVADILADQAVDLTDFVENLLIFARANVGELSVQTRTVDVGGVIDTVTGAWSGADRSRLVVRGRAEVRADSLRLRQVMRNLLSNALRHGGDHIEVRIIPDHPDVRIQVADNGPGIPDDLRSRMFRPYQHGELSGQPATLGLGLTVARSLSRRMGGDLTYEARPLESLFILTLPAADPQAPDHPPPAPPDDTPARRGVVTHAGD
jgi:signal transduction histidine kinase